MPKDRWAGYGRFCPMARALDVVGDRWTLVIVQELMMRPSRYGDLSRRLPGIGSTVLAERLRKLEAAGVVERRPGAVGQGVMYAATERGLALADTLESLRRWGVAFLTDPTADGGECQTFDVHYVEGIEHLDSAEFGLVVDSMPTTLRFADGSLEQIPGEPATPE
ncbi:MAG: helix-turn-helix transcriptional regulator, partial [Chloroflexi bacterium]